MKKVNVVRDETGTVIATFENPTAGGPTVRPALRPGHTVHEVEAEEDYMAHLASFYERHSR